MRSQEQERFITFTTVTVTVRFFFGKSLYLRVFLKKAPGVSPQSSRSISFDEAFEETDIFYVSTDYPLPFPMIRPLSRLFP